MAEMAFREKPECQFLLGQVRALAKLAKEMCNQADRESGAVGMLWGVDRAMQEALTCAESELSLEEK